MEDTFAPVFTPATYEMQPPPEPPSAVLPQRPPEEPLDQSERLRPATYACISYHYYTGQITGHFDVPSTHIVEWIAEHVDHHLMTSAWADRQYVDVTTKQLIERPENTTTLDGMVLKNIPAVILPQSVVDTPTEGVQTVTSIVITHDNDPASAMFFEVEDDTVELDFPNPGSYVVTVRAFPYKDKVIEVIV